MESAILVVTHLSVMGAAFAFGRILGFRDAQPLRDKRGRFIKRSD